MNTKNTQQKALLIDLWEGNLGLGYDLLGLRCAGRYCLGVGISALEPDPEGELLKVVWQLFACYYFVAYVGIWKAANKYSGNKAWAILAKFAIIVVVLPVVIHFLKWLVED